MICGGNATIVVRDMDASIRFYTEVLDLKLVSRYDDHWATVAAGDSLTLGIHPPSPEYPAPGTRGAIFLGLDLDVPADAAVVHLEKHGIAVRSVVRSETGNFVQLEDPDGNQIYLWEKVGEMRSVTEMRR